MKPDQNWRSLFDFTRHERRGIYVLLVIWTVLMITRFLLKTAPLEPVPLAASEVKVWSDSLDRKIELHQRQPSYPWKLHPFNPNRTKAVEYKKMGYPPGFIDALFQFKREHNFINSEEEFLSLWPFTSSQIQDIRANIELTYKPVQTVGYQREFAGQKHKSAKHLSIRINHADTAEWMQVRGIGPVLAKRIVLYRNLLGGFHHPNQLYEVYGLDSNVINPQFIEFISDGILNKLPVNQLDAKELSRHPYLTWKEAGSLVQYRKQHGKYNAMRDLKKVMALDSNRLKKLEPYLDFH